MNLDKSIYLSIKVLVQQKFIKNITDINCHLQKGQTYCKTVYDFLYNQSQIEGQILEIQKEELNFIKETDKILNKRLKELKKKIDKQKSINFKKKDKLTTKSQSNLKVLEKKYKI